MYTKLTCALVAFLATTSAVRLGHEHENQADASNAAGNDMMDSTDPMPVEGKDCGCDGCCGGNDVDIKIAFNVNVVPKASSDAAAGDNADGSTGTDSGSAANAN